MILQSNASRDEEQLLDQAIAEFLRTESSGRSPDRQPWLDRYPGCAAGLLEFFDDWECVDQLVMPVRVDRPYSSTDPDATEAFDTSNPPPDSRSDDLAPTPPEFTTPRYRPLHFHARGGMGEVWLAHDERIGRQVAIKKLRTGREARQSRFIVEAQVTGQLEHPSVVPLHDLGVDDAGQPYYVMKYIHGRSLGEAIVDYHAHKARLDWPADLQFLRLLEAFVSVCNAVGYAHSKGVLHRDIKPSNVMLGAYGETLVLDWGLAKVVGHGQLDHDAAVRVSADDSVTTQDGDIVGTPVYMSPEEARGETEAVDHSSDVYLLGSTLYEILTARPPRQGSSRWELLDLARKSRPISPRKLDPQIPRALEAICAKAMAFDKKDRYATAMALAEDVQRFVAGEPTVAYSEPLPARIARWVRRHRRGITRGLVVAGAIALSIFALQSYRQARLLADRERARVRLSDFHRLADEAQFYAANTDAVSERVPYYDARRAKAVGEAALAIAAPFGSQAERLPLAELRADFLQSHYDLLLLMARAHLQGTREPPGARAALALLDQAKAIQQPSRGYFQLRSRCLALVGDHDGAQGESDRAMQPGTPVAAGDCFLAGELLRLDDAGSVADSLGDRAEPRREHLAKAIEQYRTALGLDPRHYWAQFQLGRCLLALGRGPEAVEALSACVAMRPNSVWAYATRGLASGLSGRPKEALADLDRAVELDPDFQPARLNRGVVHWLQEDAAAAMADFSAVLAAGVDKRLIEAAYYRGQVYLKTDRPHEALADLSMVIGARPDFRPAYGLRAQAHFRLANGDDGQADLAKFLTLGKPKPAGSQPVDSRIAMGRALRQLALVLVGEAKGQALARALRELDAAIAAGPPTAEMYEHQGAVQEMLGQLPQAIASYSKGLELSADRVVLRNMRAWGYVNTQQFDLARADFSEAIRRDPDNPESHAGLGFAMAEAEANDDAQAQALVATLSGADNYLILHNVACIYGRLSKSTKTNRIEYEDMALAALRRAVALSQQNPAGPDEIALIRQETAFPDSLRARPEFERLLSGRALGNP